MLPAVTADVFAGEDRRPAFLAINPAAQIPALRGDDRRTLGEATAIAEYLEELNPSRRLIGNTSAARADTTVVALSGAQCHRIHLQQRSLCRRIGAA